MSPYSVRIAVNHVSSVHNDGTSDVTSRRILLSSKSESKEEARGRERVSIALNMYTRY